MPLEALRAFLFSGGDPGVMELQLKVHRRHLHPRNKPHQAEACGWGAYLVCLGAPQKLRVEPSNLGDHPAGCPQQ